MANASMGTERPKGLSRRDLLARGAAAGAALVVSGGAVFCPAEGWATEANALKPETLKTLIKLARDIYPHDRIADKYYALAVKTYDSGEKPDDAKLVEQGIAALDALAEARHRSAYAAVGWEADRVALLREIEAGAFFQKVRGGLVVALYDQKEVWPVFGYEGESFSKGGYIERGFADIQWI